MLISVLSNLQNIKQRGLTEEESGIYGIEGHPLLADTGNDISI